MTKMEDCSSLSSTIHVKQAMFYFKLGFMFVAPATGSVGHDNISVQRSDRLKTKLLLLSKILPKLSTANIQVYRFALVELHGSRPKQRLNCLTASICCPVSFKLHFYTTNLQQQINKYNREMLLIRRKSQKY